MLFSNYLSTILVCTLLYFVAFGTAFNIRGSVGNLVEAFEEKDFSGCAKIVRLIILQIVVFITLILNWCNAAAVALVGYLAIIAFWSASEVVSSVSVSDILAMLGLFGVPIMSVAASCLVTICTQAYTPATKQIERHELRSYQIKHALDYEGEQHKLSCDRTIVFICEDSYSGELELDSNVHLCVDTENPRVEVITYTQELVEQVVTGGTIGFGSQETFRETVFYLPDVNSLPSSSVLPDE